MKIDLEGYPTEAMQKFLETGELTEGVMQFIGLITQDHVRERLEAVWDAKERIRCAEDRDNRHACPRRYMASYEWGFMGFDLELDNWDPKWETDRETVPYSEFLESDVVEETRKRAEQAEQRADERQRQKEARDAAEKEVRERAEYERLKAKFG